MQISMQRVLISFIMTTTVKVYLQRAKLHFNLVIEDNSTSEVSNLKLIMSWTVEMYPSIHLKSSDWNKLTATHGDHVRATWNEQGPSIDHQLVWILRVVRETWHMKVKMVCQYWRKEVQNGPLLCLWDIF